MDAKAAIKTLLGMAASSLAMRNATRLEHTADYHGACAYTYYTSAWIVAGTPSQSDEWPGFATWSARETKSRAA